MYFCYMQSPVGKLLLAGDQDSVKLIGFDTGRQVCQPGVDWYEDERPLRESIRQLDAYFCGKRRAFNLPLSPVGTPFQRRVWQALLDVPYGETQSYGEIARRIGKPRAVRAVGAANGANPLPIVVPCHRVIGANGDLTGYGGGLGIKRKLLALEQGEQTLF